MMEKGKKENLKENEKRKKRYIFEKNP